MKMQMLIVPVVVEGGTQPEPLNAEPELIEVSTDNIRSAAEIALTRYKLLHPMAGHVQIKLAGFGSIH